jgi:PHP family Zn ribbon phosphoesterase
MRFIADLHIHSKYSRACSPQLTLENIDAWCAVKGIDIVSCADFTHPVWFKEIQEKLEPSRFPGLYQLKNGLAPSFPPPLMKGGNGEVVKGTKLTLFLMGTEIACIYRHKEKTRRVHLCVFAPNLEVVAKINKALTAAGGKLASDGRPILGMSSKALLQLILEVDPRCVMIPAHAWTPWFAIFGSESGYDSISECFEELTPHIFAIETGVSADPLMCWRVKALDNIALVSHSDIHSLPNLGREADVFEGEETALSYDAIMQAIREASPKRRAEIYGAQFPISNPSTSSGQVFQFPNKSQIQNSKNPNYLNNPNNPNYPSLRMLGTIEFFPDEGRYHFDGHRVCGVRLHPSETKKLNGICPKCKKPVTVGVLSRVETLATEKEGRVPPGAPGFWSLVELDKIIAEAEGVKGRASKAVEKIYWDLVSKAGTEMNILLNLSREELLKITSPKVTEAIMRVREKKVTVDPGYDGEYGKVKIFSEGEQQGNKQKSLF